MNKTFVIVPDFIWGVDGQKNLFKSALKNFANEVGRIYIDFLSYPGLTNTVEYTSNGFLANPSHLGTKGVQIISEVIAKKLQLGVISKKVIESLKRKEVDDWIYVENSEISSSYTNSNLLPKYKMKYRTNNDCIDFTILLNTNSASNNSKIFNFPSGFRLFGNVTFLVSTGVFGTN